MIILFYVTWKLWENFDQKPERIRLVRLLYVYYLIILFLPLEKIGHKKCSLIPYGTTL